MAQDMVRNAQKNPDKRAKELQKEEADTSVVIT